jgi:hypothetical protein
VGAHSVVAVTHLGRGFEALVPVSSISGTLLKGGVVDRFMGDREERVVSLRCDKKWNLANAPEAMLLVRTTRWK